MAVTASSLGQFGARLLAPDNTRFSLWAPDASRVEVVFPDKSPVSLKAQGDQGWFEADVACGAGTRYQFAVDGGNPVPDPASRAQADDVHGWSVVVDLAAYSWTCPEWSGRPWHETVLYELHTGLMGNYAGIEQHLERLVALGVTAIELMPLNDFPGQRNWGYDGVLCYAPASAYGTPEALQHLIDRAHAHGLMVFLDVVYNHFGPDGNYLGQYASGFFRDDIPTPWGQAIDFRRRPVRDFFIENAIMWVRDYRFDGLRLDAVHAISERDFLVELAERVRAAAGPDRHVHLVLENEKNGASLLESSYEAQWNDDGHNILHHLLTGEKVAYYSEYMKEPTQKLARCLSDGFIFQGETTRRGHARGEPSGHLSPLAFVLFLQNHDQTGNRALGDRLITLCDPLALKAATALLLLSPMIPMLFMGEEWGCRKPFLFFTDHHDELADAVREGRRNEFKEFPAFTDPEARERIPDPNAESTYTASRPDFEQAGRGEWAELYAQLLALRTREIVPVLRGSEALGATVLAEKAVCARWRMGNGRVLHIALNLGDADVRISAASGTLLHESRAAFDRYQAGELMARSALVIWEDA